MEKIRTFVAIEVPDAIREQLGALQQQFGGLVPKEAVRWTPVQQIHVTLQFLGSVALADVEGIKTALATVATMHRRFTIAAGGMGAFPSERKPRVIWSAVSGEIEALQALPREVAAATRAWCGKEEKRDYHPHLTLGRVREVGPRDLRRVSAALVGMKIGSLGEWVVREFLLMESKLSPHGAQHSVLARFKLSGDKA